MQLCFKKQYGQILPLALAGSLMLIALIYLIFNTFQLGSTKSQLTNTADAAAYSGAVWQARTLNYQAYTNRAMVANQVAVAQVISLLNWTRYADVTVDNLDLIATIILPLKPFTAVAAQVTEAMKNMTQSLSNVYLPVLDTLNQFLSKSQKLVYESTTLVTADVVQQVVKKNNDNYKLSPTAIAWLIENAKEWREFTQSYEDEEGLDRKAGMINHSRDNFTEGDRKLKIRGLPLGRERQFVRKNGYTRLQKHVESEGSVPEWQWKAKDNLELVHQKFECSFSGCGWKTKKETPFGWAQTQVSTTGQDIDQCPRCRWTANRQAEYIGMGLAEDEKKYGGVQHYFDMANLDKEDEKSHDQRLLLKVEVIVPAAHIRTSSRIKGIGASPKTESASSTTSTDKGQLLGQGASALHEDFAKDATSGSTISSYAAAEVFFSRPVVRKKGQFGARDSLVEYSNLFNPYWGVKLVEERVGRRLLWALRGVIFSPSFSKLGKTPAASQQSTSE